RRHFLAFLLIVGTGALLSAVLYVGALAAFSILPPERLLVAVHRGWIGDTVGLLVTLPVLLVLGPRERPGPRRALPAQLVRVTVGWCVVPLVVGGGWLAVFPRPADEQFTLFYLLLLPAVWGSAHFGFTGAVWSSALVQVLLIAAVQSADYRPLTVFELQLLM